IHAEHAYGLARTGQTIVNVPDASVLQLYVDDEPLYIPTARLRRYERVLDMRGGTLARELEWSTPSGKHVLVRSCRLVSFEHRHLVAIEYEVVLRDRGAPIVICSQVADPQDGVLPVAGDGDAIDPRMAMRLAHRVLSAEHAEADGTRILLGYRTANSGMTLGIGLDHVIESDTPFETAVTVDDDNGELVITADAQPGVPIRVTKYIAYQSSRVVAPAELVDRCSWTLARAKRTGFASLRASQREHLDHFWERADVQVDTGLDSSARTQQALRWNLFQLAQATLRAEGAGVPAKGLTGQGYEGHYFWDTEVYLLPFLSYTQPRIARNLLRFRHSMLPRARERAAVLGQRGAMFPWRTINGEEASANYQAGTAQYHLNADIAYAIRRYVDVRGDVDFLAEMGAEVLVETARLWADLGFYADDDEFHLHGVTGPDEYTTVVNDNTYTNLMARQNLSYAAAALRRLEAERPEAHRALVEELGLDAAEVTEWERAAAAMHVPYDERRGIHPQDTSFLEREPWDFAHTPPDRYPLLLHYHPLVIYRHQVIKQADIVLAMFLLGHEFTSEQKKANFDYYDALTTGDSSLSACMQAIVAAEVGDEARALEYFRFALLLDLADAAGNASDGVHIASAAGVWQALVYGFGGVRDEGGELSITPHLPAGWNSLAFSLRFGDRQLRVRLTHDEERYLLESGAPLPLTICGCEHVLEQDRPLCLRAEPTTDLTAYQALLFDLDGVITRTATIHAAAWKALFDDFLERRAKERDAAFEPFEIATDYVRHVDGKRRYDGVDAFLRSRGIALPWGTPEDPPGDDTVCAVGNAKNRRFAAELRRHDVEVYDDTVALIRAARAAGTKTAVVSASENCHEILRRAGLLELFDAEVTGIEAAQLGLAGKPAPDTFLKAAELLGVAPEHAVVFEDALSGVQAGRAAGFGLVVGVDRGGVGDALIANGADIACADLRRLGPRA
ncbi:MAG: beta-phosphoglucomutase family hydrolase, partial [Gemmatirosa sp.]